MKKLHRYAACVCALSSLTLLAADWSTVGQQSRASEPQFESAELVKQAKAKMEASDSPQTFQEAADILEEAVKRDPDNFDARLTLGWVYLDRLHEPDKAYRHLAKAAKLNPNDVNARKLCGLACSQTGRPRKAVREFSAAAQLEPNDLWIRAHLARSLARTGHLDEANQLYAEVLASEPTNTDARLGQAEIAAWRGHTDGPLDTLNQLANENPTNTEVLLLRGDVHRWNWDLTEAKRDYNLVSETDINSYPAKLGLAEAHWMGASGINLGAYYFKDKTDFTRENAQAGARVHIADEAYLIGNVAGWRFKNPGFSNIERRDADAGLEFHFARWIEITGEGTVYDYIKRDPVVGGRLSTKISPVTGTDIYLNAAYKQPFISSILTVQSALRQDTIGAGLDTKLAGRFSLQAEAQGARISDDNEWVEVKPALSYRLLDVPKVFIRAEYDYLSYSESRTNYWSPHNRNTVGPVLDVSIPIGRCFQLNGVGKAPYVFDESKFGFQVEGGPVIDLFHHAQLKGSYYYSTIPGDEGAWSGHGWMASLIIRF